MFGLVARCRVRKPVDYTQNLNRLRLQVVKARTYSFGYWLRRRRKALDLTQRALAQAVSCSEDAIRKVEADERRPSRRLAERIADRLAIPVEERAAFLDAARALHSTGALAVDEGPVEAGVDSQRTLAATRGLPAQTPGVLSPDRSSAAVFVGRHEELAALQRLFESMRSGQGVMAILAGEPGIGKTRTAHELAVYAVAHGAVVLWGRCHESAGAPSYWPWVQAIRAYLRDRSTDELRIELGASAASISEIVEEIRDRLPDLKFVAALEPEAARFRLFDAIATLLQNIGRRAPVVLILDDLHWADQSSLRLLEFVAGELKRGRLLLLGTYRDAEISRKHPLSHALAEVVRHGAVHRTTLRGLSRDDVARFIASMWPPSALPDGLVEAVYRQTEGNPLFVTEVVRLLVQEERSRVDAASDDANWWVRIPEGVRQVIGRRLDRLSERCNQALSIAAVIGRQFTLNQLAVLIDDASESQLLDLLDEAIAAHVIEEVPRAIDQFQFTHALIGETLAEELSSTRRVRLHAQIGQALETLYGTEVVQHAAEVAHHFAQAAMLIGTEQLIRYSVLAGERALATHAYEEALTHFEQAMAAKESKPTDAETAAILFGSGRAQLATLERHRFRDAVATLHHSFDAYVKVGDLRGALDVADYSLPDFPGFDVAMASVIQRAIESVPPDSKEIGRLLSRRGRVVGMQAGDYEGAASAFADARGIARRLSDVALEMRILVSAAYVDFFHRRYAESIRKGLDALAMAADVDDLQAEVTARYWIACARRDTGDLPGMKKEVLEIVGRSERLSHRFWRAGACWLGENNHRLNGEWDEARRYSDQGLAISPRDFRLHATRALLEYETGEFDQGYRRLEQLVEIMRLTPPDAAPEYSFVALTVPIASSISGDRRLMHEARAAANQVLSTPGATPVARLLSQVGLALSAVQEADRGAAGELYAALGSPCEVMPPPGSISFDRLLGRLASVMGDYHAATAHFERASTDCQRGGYLPEQAWVAYDLAHCLIAHGSSTDLSRAEALTGDAYSIASALRMRPLMERASALQRDLVALNLARPSPQINPSPARSSPPGRPSRGPSH